MEAGPTDDFNKENKGKGNEMLLSRLGYKWFLHLSCQLFCCNGSQLAMLSNFLMKEAQDQGLKEAPS